MKYLAIVTFFVLTIICAGFATEASAQKKGASAASGSLRIAVINSSEVFNQYPEAVAANQKFQAMSKAVQDSLTLMQQRFNDKAETLKSLGDQMSADAKKKLQDELNTMDEGYRKYYNAEVGQDGALAKQRDALFKPISDKVAAAVQSFGKEQNYSLVLDKAAAIYVDGAIDATQKFIDFLKGTK